jgi:transposase-like protein
MKMKYIPPSFNKLSEMAYIDVCRLTEEQARTILENIRWKNGIVCPHCQSKRVVKIKGKSDTVRDGIIRCNDCCKQFTVTVGTIIQGSHVTLRQWLQAFYSMCASKKGVSALQLQRNLGLHSYHSAWYLAHRIRKAMTIEPKLKGLKGIVEVDETYVGGKPRRYDGIERKRGRGTLKAPVMLERNGRAISKPIDNVSASTLQSAIKEMVNKNATIMTDEWKSYNGIGRNFKGGHQIVNHSMGEYVNGTANTNTAESYFALLKRGITGTFHHISKKHLSRYCNEFSFRWDNRQVTDGERTENAIRGILGKRLMLKEVVGG